MQLHIPQPCTENWQHMDPEGQGRFCTSCSQVVVDFTRMSDEEVRNYFLQHSRQKTCGRFYRHQLAQPLKEQPVSLPRHCWNKQPYSRQLLYVITLLFIIGVSSCELSEPYNTVPKEQIVLLGAPVVPESDTLVPGPAPKANIIRIIPPVEKAVKDQTDTITGPDQDFFRGGIPIEPATGVEIAEPDVRLKDTLNSN